MLPSLRVPLAPDPSQRKSLAQARRSGRHMPSRFKHRLIALGVGSLFSSTKIRETSFLVRKGLTPVSPSHPLPMANLLKLQDPFSLHGPSGFMKKRPKVSVGQSYSCLYYSLFPSWRTYLSQIRGPCNGFMKAFRLRNLGQVVLRVEQGCFA